MAQVIVRNLDDSVVASLKQKASLHNRSLEQELREILTAAARLSPEERVALSRTIRALAPKDVPQTDSVDLIRQMRDAR